MKTSKRKKCREIDRCGHAYREVGNIDAFFCGIPRRKWCLKKRKNTPYSE